MMLRDIFEKHQQLQPHAVAIEGLGKEGLTYQELWDQIRYVGGQLRALGIGRKDKVAVVLPNGPEMAVAFIAVACSCAVAPLNPGYRESEFEFYLKDLRAKAIIIMDQMATDALVTAEKLDTLVMKLLPDDKVAGVFKLNANVKTVGSDDPPASEQDVALILHTSGTTSRPKMVPLTQTNILSSARNVSATLQLNSQDICLNIMPLFHIHGLIGVLLSSMISGGRVACSPGFFGPDFFSWVQLFRPTWYSAVPTMHQGILQRVPRYQKVIPQMRLRFIRSSSSSLPPNVMKELETVFRAPVIESYGMTEAAHQMASNPLSTGRQKPGSVGPAAGPEMGVMNEQGDLLAASQEGEIVIKGNNVTNGYAQNPQANEKAFTNGWFRTGDQGYCDDQGYFFITGRIKEIINRGGEKISPREIDELMLTHKAVLQATAFAIPHGILGEEIGLAVILKKGSHLDELQVREYLSKHLADFKVPRVVLFVDEIPKGPTGKLQRIGLAKKFGIDMSYQSPDQLQEVEFLAPRTLLESQLQQIWKQVLRTKVGIADNFFFLGGDSMVATKIISRYKKELTYQITYLKFFENPTVQTQARSILINQLQNEGQVEYHLLEGQIKDLPEQEAALVLKALSQ